MHLLKWNFLWILAVLLTACGETTTTKINTKTQIAQSIAGKTMGTTYTISFLGAPNQAVALKASVDSLLEAYNDEVSHYIPTSTISRFNKDSLGLTLDKTANAYMLENLALTQLVTQQTEGWLDPTVMPLVNFWGFGYTEKKPVENVDSADIIQMLTYVGLDKIEQKELGDSVRLLKTHPKIQLDFSACAKGYGVDVVGRYLEQQNIQNYMVEIGREVRARGQHPQRRNWRIGINTPKEDAELSDIETVIGLDDMSIATSGNYRNYHTVKGKKYAHTINPKTGYPEYSDLLSASIFHADCGTADAYATACMAMGFESAKLLVEETDNLEAVFIYSNEEGEMQLYFTAGAEKIKVR